MAQGHTINHRKTHFVKKDFQVGFIIKFCLLLLLGVVISTCLLFLFSQDTLTSSFHQSRLVIKTTGIAILPAVVYTNLITLGIVTLAAIFVTLYISHKIAGPIFRFEKELGNIGNGDLTSKINLRENDQVTDMADSINQMVSSLHEKIQDIKTDVDDLKESAVKQSATEIVINKIDDIHQKIEQTFKT